MANLGASCGAHTIHDAGRAAHPAFICTVLDMNTLQFFILL